MRIFESASRNHPFDHFFPGLAGFETIRRSAMDEVTIWPRRSWQRGEPMVAQDKIRGEAVDHRRQVRRIDATHNEARRWRVLFERGGIVRRKATVVDCRIRTTLRK